MNGFWITVPGESKRENLYFSARKKFDIAKVANGQKLHIAAESYYMLWVNGKTVGRGPARGSRNVNFFDTYDVEQYLRTGENWIAALVQSMNVPNYCSFPSAAAVMIELEGITSTGTGWEVSPSNEWRGKVQIYTKQTGFCEYRDLRQTPLGWQTGTDNAEWFKPEIIGNASEAFGKKLLSRPIPELRTVSYLPAEIARTAVTVSVPDIPDIEIARAIDEAKHMDVDGKLSTLCTPLLTDGEHQVLVRPPENGDGVSITFDFHREIIGFPELKLTAPSGTSVDISHGEDLFEGRVVALRCNHYNFADRFITRGGTQLVGNTLHERGFRFMEIVFRDFKEPVILHSVHAVDRRYPFPQRGAFQCSDMLLNKIWDVCLETLSACTTDVFTDCPWRERAFWVNDMTVGNIVSLQAFGDYRLNAHALRLAMSNRRKDGWLPSICPDTGNSRNILVPTNLLVMLALKDYYWYSGDSVLLKELLPEMLEILELFEPLMDADRQIVPPKEMWNFVDWGYRESGVIHDGRASSVLGWLYCVALGTVADLLELVGRKEDAGKLRSKRRPAADGIERRFWQEDRKMYAELEETDKLKIAFSQLSHAFALLSGVLPAERRSDALAALRSPATITPELFMFHFVLNQLRDNGCQELALTHIRRYWGAIINTGSPTIWEMGVYDKFFKSRAPVYGMSLCHGFNTTPVNYFQTAILGVRPLKPGFQVFEVNPVAHDLEFAGGSIPTPNGNIRIKWNRKGNEINVELFIPDGLSAQTSAGILSPGNHQFSQPMPHK